MAGTEKHSQARIASEEILRIVIQKMAAHPAAFTPHAYAVWYEYVQGVNAALSAEMDGLLGGQQHINDAAIEHLFESHVSEFKQDINRILREDMKQMLNKLIEITQATHTQTKSFGNSLQEYGNQLRTNPGSLILDELIARMASDTKSMQGSVTNLHSELEHSKEEVGKLQKALESARKEALIDPLTSIYNRRGFEIQVRKMFADSGLMEKGACMLMVDIDHFKQINDSYGHLFGDKVIRTLANTLKSLVKGQDCVARMGGEEFAVMLPGTALAGASTVAEHIRATIEQGKIRHLNSDVETSSITISIGIAPYQSGSTLEEWLDCADKALYISKQKGRNRVTVFQAT
jgi:diguanylate cyclase